MMNKRELDRMVGANIKRERERAGYTQDSFSELLGIGPKSLSAIERGVVGVSLQTLVKICRVLYIAPNVLLAEQSHENDLSDLTDRLQHLSPAQLEIARNVLTELMKAFDLA